MPGVKTIKMALAKDLAIYKERIVKNFANAMYDKNINK